MHACGNLLDLAGPGEIPVTLQHINQALEPMRMPLFFLVSGILASSAIHRPWRDTAARTSGMLYLYVLWMAGFMGFKLLFAVTSPEPIASILFAKSGFWYLYAVALFFVIARLLRNQPAWVVVGVAIVPNLLRPFTQLFFDSVVPGSLATSMAMNLGFFLLGAYYKDVLIAFAARTTWVSTVLLGAATVVGVSVWLRTPIAVGESYLGLSLLGMAFAISLAAQVTRTGCPGWLRYVSARTLSIYLLQWPVVFLLFEFWPRSTLQSPTAQLVYPVLVTTLIATMAMWLQNRPELRLAFRAPAWVTGRHPVPTPDVEVTRPSSTSGLLTPTP